MWHCAGYAKELCESLGLASADKRAATLAAHLTRFSPSIPVNSETVIALIGHSVDVAMKYVTASGLGQPKTALLDAFAALRAAGEVASPAPAPAPAPEKTQPVTTAAEPAPVPADTPAQALPTESKVTPERPAAPGFASKLVRAWRSLF
jgi:predicted component of type VI protein secretion system